MPIHIGMRRGLIIRQRGTKEANVRKAIEAYAPMAEDALLSMLVAMAALKRVNFEKYCLTKRAIRRKISMPSFFEWLMPDNALNNTLIATRDLVSLMVMLEMSEGVTSELMDKLNDRLINLQLPRVKDDGTRIVFVAV